MAFLSKGRVLVTGLQGFTGGYLEVILRSSGYEVYGLVSGAPRSYTEHQVDIRDAKAVADVVGAVMPDYVVHLAAISFVAHGDNTEIYDVNIKGTLNLVEALRNVAKPVKKLLIASSGNIYGAASTKQLMSEDADLRPLNHYGISKLTAEHIARLSADRIPVIIVRPFNYTGIGQSSSFVVPKLVAAFRNGEREILLGNIDTVRDFSDVRWMAAVYHRLMESQESNETVNVCSGQGIRIRDILSELEKLAGYRINVDTDKSLLRTQEIQYLVGSPWKLESLIEIPPRPAFAETLSWMYSADSQ